MAQDHARVLLKELALHLEYPHDGISVKISKSLEAMEPVKEFAALMRTMEPWMKQEHYVQSFDVSPRCSLYLSVHLFGEESFKRAEFMAGLKEVYQRGVFHEEAELPDHLAVVLKHNDLFLEEEWAELVSMCLLPALGKMTKDLEAAGNPYSLILNAAAALLKETEKAYV